MLGTGGGGEAPMVIRFSRSLLAADRWWGTGLKVLLLLELFLRKDVDVGSCTCKDTTPVEVVTVEPRGRSPTALLLLVSPDDKVVVVVALGAGTGPPCESCDDDI